MKCRKEENMIKHSSKIPAFLLAGTLLFIIGCGANNTTENNTDNNTIGDTGNNGTQAQNMLTETEARQYALEKAGLDTAIFTRQEYDAHDKEYEFEFHTESTEYDCDINASDGAIRSYSTEERTVFD